MVDRNQARKSGKTAGEEYLQEVSQEADQTTTVELPDERQRLFRTPGFSRMRTDWRGEDAFMMTRVHEAVDKLVGESFADAYSIMYELYCVVREPVMDGEAPKTDADGFVVWRRNATGSYVEDWEKLRTRDRERFLFLITTRLFEWTQKASSAWAEAMFAKALWEDAFSLGYEELEGSKPTVDARTAHGRIASRDERYFAIFTTYYSRKVDAIVKSMELLSQRLKDVHVSNGSR